MAMKNLDTFGGLELVWS